MKTMGRKHEIDDVFKVAQRMKGSVKYGVCSENGNGI